MTRSWVALVLLIAGASGAGAQDVVTNLTKQSMEIYFECLQGAVPKLDDLASDASTIARGAMGACSQEANDIVLIAAGNDAHLANRMRELVDAKGLERGTTYVLQHRVARRSAPPGPPSKPKQKAKPKGESI